MRLLDRYLLRELVIPLGYCLAAFLIFWVSFELFQELSDLQRDGMGAGDIAAYYVWRLPELLGTVLPVSLLLALLYALTQHSRHHELTAMRAAGISLWRISLPYAAVGTVCSLGLLAVAEIWGPDSLRQAEQLRKRQAAQAGGRATTLRNFGFKSGQGHLWQMDAYEPDTGEMSSVHVGWRLPEGGRREIVARRGHWRAGGWEFLDVVDTVFGADPASMPERTGQATLEVPELTETPDQIRAAIKVNELFSSRAQLGKRPQLSVREILDYRRLHPSDNAHAPALLTQLHGRLAAPWMCLVVVWIALPFGALPGRRNAFAGVAASVFIGFAYFLVLKVGLTLGPGGRLPPWLAAWGPNLLFTALGLGLIRRLR